MQFGVIGLSYKTAPLNLLERFSQICKARFGSGVHPLHTPETVLLSTCNRVELYFSSGELSKSHTALLERLRPHMGEPFEQRLYSFFGRDCLMHLSEVTAGLKSRLIGESDIQGQVKRSYLASAQAKALPSSLHYLFQKSLKNGKEVRRLFPTPKGTPTLEREVAGEMERWEGAKRVLLIGASSLSKKLLHLIKRRYAITLATRNPERAEEIFDGDIRGWEVIEDIRKFDVIITATCHKFPLIQGASPRPHLYIDLSLPHLIDKSVLLTPSSRLITLDHLHQSVEKKRTSFFQDVKLKQETLIRKVDYQMQRVGKTPFAPSLSLCH